MSEKLERFVNLMKGIFELDKSDLDFGIYRIMNIRKAEIEKFLSEGLPQKIMETLAPFASDTSKIEKRIAEIEAKCEDVGLEVSASKMADEYVELKAKLVSGVDMSALEADVYSALYNFFNRYYDEGDFISKRRYKEGVYAIPYEGEEVKLYWANQDQYYIKTSENFKDYTFKVDDYTIHFRIVDATTEQNNNKENDNSKRQFMLYVENEEFPEIKTFEHNVDTKEIIIRFVYDIPEDKKRKYKEENYKAVHDYIYNSRVPVWEELLRPISIGKGKDTTTLLEKHMNAYVAKNTFDYFIHKDLKGFLRRELDFYIKNEIMHLDDLDTTNEQRVETYLAKIRAVKRVGHIIIDFLAQIENFQKKLWLKKKFVIETNWCITLDRIDESFYPEIIANKAQVQEWIDMYAIDEETESFTNPPTVEFLQQNQNLVVDTKHFSEDFKERLIASIDNLDDKINGLMINGENYQALRLIETKSIGEYDAIQLDPPYNTDTSGFLYKNNYKHSSWASMMFDRISLADTFLNYDGIFRCHIDENEYETLFKLFEMLPRHSAGTIIWNKLNPMLGRQGIATQHEYVIFRTHSLESIYAINNNSKTILEYASNCIRENNGINENTRKQFAKLVSSNSHFSNGDKAYHYLDDNGNVYRLVAMGAPEKRDNNKYFIPLIHPITNKPCPVPPNGWSRKPETMRDMIAHGTIIFGKDEKTQPQKKVILSNDSLKQLSSVIEDGKSGKKFLQDFGLEFPYAHPVSLYETLLSANMPMNVLDFFAGSGTTGNAVVNLSRKDNKERKYTLIEMGKCFDNVCMPRMKKVVYSADWKNGKPTNRNTGVSHIMKYMKLESYEDALSNITLDNQKHGLSSILGEDYLINYMLDIEAEGSLLNLDAFKSPFDYRLKVNENNETKEKNIDVVETFNYLIGLTVKNSCAVTYFDAFPDRNGEYEGAVELSESRDGEYSFKQIDGTLPDGRKALVIWRTISDDIIESNAALDAYFTKHRINPHNTEYDIIYVNGDNNLQNLSDSDDGFKVKIIEIEFKKRMFEEE